jgi:hypothetical protein
VIGPGEEEARMTHLIPSTASVRVTTGPAWALLANGAAMRDLLTEALALVRERGE